MPLVDLDDPEELRARWSALAAVAHATGYDRRWYADAHGWYHQDETGSDLRMARLDGGRAVLFGFHTQHTQTGEADLLAGAPPWIGQPEVKRRMAAGELGFVYGSFNGTWARASYPGDPWQPLDDGFLPIGEWITSDEEAAREMIEWAAEWADYLGGLDEVLPVGVRLIRTVATTGITVEALQELFTALGIGPHSAQQPDLQAALAAAAEFDGSTVSQPVPAPVVGSGRAPAAASSDDADTDASPGGAFPPIEDDEESVAVPPGISPFTGKPIGADDANLIIGGPDPYAGVNEPYPAGPAAGEPYSADPYASEASSASSAGTSEPFAPEPPFTPEPPFRPDSPFAPEPQPPAPEPPFTPGPAPDPPYQPDDTPDAYGVVAKKPRLFRRRKHENQDPQPPAPKGGSWSNAAPYNPQAPVDRPNAGPYAPQPEADPYAPQSGTDPYAQQAGADPHAQRPGADPYAQPGNASYAPQSGTGPYAPQPGSDSSVPQSGTEQRRSAGSPTPTYGAPTAPAQNGEQPGPGEPGAPPAPGQYRAQPAPGQPADDAPAAGQYAIRNHSGDARDLPSAEPPRVGGPIDDGEDFYASLFADAPAAASYVPDVVRNTPADQQPWSADDATSEIAAVPDDLAADGSDGSLAANDLAADDRDGSLALQTPAADDRDGSFASHGSDLSATDDTGVITPIPDADDSASPVQPAEVREGSQPADSTQAQQPYAAGSLGAPQLQDHRSEPAGQPGTPAGLPDSATEREPANQPEQHIGHEADAHLPSATEYEVDARSEQATEHQPGGKPGHTAESAPGAQPGQATEYQRGAQSGPGAEYELGARPGRATEYGAGPQPNRATESGPDTQSDAATEYEADARAGMATEYAAYETDVQRGSGTEYEEYAGPQSDARSGSGDAALAETDAVALSDASVADERSGTGTDYRTDARPEVLDGRELAAEMHPEPDVALEPDLAAAPVVAQELEAEPQVEPEPEAEPELEVLPEPEVVAEPEVVPEPAPRPAPAVAKREWIGGAWINGVWIEDVAAYLEAQNAAGPAQAAEEEASGTEAVAQRIDEALTDEPLVDGTLIEEPPTEERVLDYEEFDRPTEHALTQDRGRGFDGRGGDSLAEDPPTEELVLDVEAFDGAADDSQQEVRAAEADGFQEAAEDPPTEERVLDVEGREGSADKPQADERALDGDDGLGASAEHPSTEERVLDVDALEGPVEYGRADGRSLDDGRLEHQAEDALAEDRGAGESERHGGGVPSNEQELGVEASGEQAAQQVPVAGPALGAEAGEAPAGERSSVPPAEARPDVASTGEQQGVVPPEVRLGAAQAGEQPGEVSADARPDVSSTGDQPGAAPTEDRPGAAAAEDRPGAVPAGERLGVVPAEERLLGVPSEDQLLGVPLDDQLIGVPVDDQLIEEPQGEVEDDAPTAEIAAISEEDPESEYYAGGSSPASSQARDIPPGGFSSLEPLDEFDYRPGLEDFHDQILGDADWTADQLGEPAAVDVTAQLEAVRDVEPQDDKQHPAQSQAQPQIEEPPAERPEKLVVPDDGGGAVAIPGLGVVGGDSPRIDSQPGSIEEAMRAEVERPRPRPKKTAAFDALHDWCRARTKIVPSGFTIQVQVLDPAAPSYRFDLEPPQVDDPEYGQDLLAELLGDLWLAESESEQGGWLFARIDVAGRTLRIDRWYDSVPDWWDNPIEARLDVDGLVRRLNGRGPDWQPSYLEKLYISAR
ncbi:hypothetical protein AB0P21_03550 [Kribbella sp. NPDC056861]|uniref:hypothetical protein n=1 Tax=Kribbella sp. NPDC056861 TaxID=3154857 RepID=UPI0034408A20